MSILNNENLKLETLNLSQKYQKTAFWQRGWGWGQLTISAITFEKFDLNKLWIDMQSISSYLNSEIRSFWF